VLPASQGRKQVDNARQARPFLFIAGKAAGPNPMAANKPEKEGNGQKAKVNNKL
jgi:hypothetical protein